jgi:hypothetical protein
MDLQEALVHQVPRDLRGLPDQLVALDQLDRQDHQEPLALMDPQDLLDPPDQLDLLDQLDLQDLQEHLVILGEIPFFIQ